MIARDTILTNKQKKTGNIEQGSSVKKKTTT